MRKNKTNTKTQKKSKNVGDFFVLTPIFPFCVLWRCTFEVDCSSDCQEAYDISAEF